MEALGPFESEPRLAVAVSGGGDSMALALLAADWVRGRAGGMTALTVDHGLRPESAAEAVQVGRWLAARGIEHRVLTWPGPHPATGVQAAAREARYRLLTQWCKEAGVLHLLLAHHAEDQAETFLLRLERGSGLDGLAAMSAVVETEAVRLLRPVLGISRRALRAVLAAHGQPWIDDPANLDRRFARTRVRALLTALEDAGLPALRVAATAAGLGRARAAAEAATATLLAGCCAADPAGFARLDPYVLAAAPAEIGQRVLARVLHAIGGRAYAPATEHIERLHGRILRARLGNGVTLGACRLLAQGGTLLVCREARGLPAPMAAEPGGCIRWDGRFRVELARHLPTGLILAPLARRGFEEIAAWNPSLRRGGVPAAAVSLPALRDGRGILWVPSLGYLRQGVVESAAALGSVRFWPRLPISGLGFAPTASL